MKKKEKKSSVLAIIPARGGSKGIPRKNLYPILGKPLIAYTIEAALLSSYIDRVLVSTDDEEIAEVAKKYGAEVPFLRPKNIAADKTPDLPVFRHALLWLKKNENYQPDMVVHLWPTSPLRKPKDINQAIILLQKNPKAHSVRSITMPSQTPFKMWRADMGKYLKPILEKEYPKLYKKSQPHSLPRQTLPKIFVQTGYIAVIRPEIILKSGSMFGSNVLPYLHKADLYTEFDSLKDLLHTEQKIKEHHGKKKNKPTR